MKTVTVLVLAVLFQTAGNLLLSRGMKQIAATSSWGTSGNFGRKLFRWHTEPSAQLPNYGSMLD